MLKIKKVWSKNKSIQCSTLEGVVMINHTVTDKMLKEGQDQNKSGFNRELFFLEDGIVFRSQEDEKVNDLLVVPS